MRGNENAGYGRTTGPKPFAGCSSHPGGASFFPSLSRYLSISLRRKRHWLPLLYPLSKPLRARSLTASGLMSRRTARSRVLRMLGRFSNRQGLSKHHFEVFSSRKITWRLFFVTPLVYG